ncbi:MAG: magnesium chelatase ATPase subunit I [Planctomycetes bacterium]|nr:magnesium chelatase ATPase subunit I [Planctomycetota bacterium]
MIEAFPFTAIVGQEDMKQALVLCAVDPGIGGVLVMGHRGTAKTTAVRGLSELLPAIDVVDGCAFNCEPGLPTPACMVCNGDASRVASIPVPVVDLPLGATEDRVAGTIDLEAALVRGKKSFEPGLLAAAHRGFLYIDEVNLLEDHLVDLLLDVAAGGENVVERESVSVRHPARFVLVGTGNPEEGDLRPQLLDRFGLSATIVTETDPEARMEIVRRRLAFEDDPAAYRVKVAWETDQLRARITAARDRCREVTLPDRLLQASASLSADLGLDGHRGEITVVRAARARAALDGRVEAEEADVRAVAALALRHRLRKDPLETRDLEHRIDEAVARHVGA